MRRIGGILLATVVLHVLWVLAPGVVSCSEAAAAQAEILSALPALAFVPVTPCRVVDTRLAQGTFGGPALAAKATRSFPIPSSSCGIPSTAQAYALNLTVVPHGSLGFLTAFPCGQTRPTASNLNSIDGRVKAVGAIVPAGSGGAVCIFVTDTTDFVMDINGYFVPEGSDPAGLDFFTLTPCRVADTRTATGPLGGPSLAARTTRAIPTLFASCGAPLTAQAYSLNYTAVPKGSLGYLTTWPAGESQPTVSTLNAPTGAVTANAAIVPAGTNGDVNVYAVNASDLVIDTNGYFAPPATGGLSFFPMTPCRVLDTRGASGPFSGTLDINVLASPCNAGGVLAQAEAFVFNATVVPASSLGFLTLWPQGTARPLVSTLNAGDAAITSNLAIVPTTNGSVSAFASNSTHLVLDISGYLAPAGGSPLKRVSGLSSFAGCEGSSFYHNAEVEPFLAINPTNANNLVGVWQQDRANSGGAAGIETGFSQDGGKSWSTTFATFTLCSGGDFERASDPYVTFAQDGSAYQIALAATNAAGTGSRDAVLESSSIDGGATWSAPVALDLLTNPNQINDKTSITADPVHNGNIYAAWDLIDFTCSSLGDGFFTFTRSTDGGKTWEPFRNVYDPGCGGQIDDNIIVVLPDGTLVDLCNLGTVSSTSVCVFRSTDEGTTWGNPIIVGSVQSIGVVDVKTGEAVRTAQFNPMIAVDHSSGNLYTVWEDAKFSGGQRDGIVISKSTDGGLHWSTPVQINQATNVQAFTPAVDVADDGTIAVTYYDFRYDTDAPGTLLTSTWLITSADGGKTWKETAIAPPFDMRSAPIMNAGVLSGYFVGDYLGLAHKGNSFLAFFGKANIHDSSNPSDIYLYDSSLAPVSAAIPPTGTTRVEVNRHPTRGLERRHPPEVRDEEED